MPTAVGAAQKVKERHYNATLSSCFLLCYEVHQIFQQLMNLKDKTWRFQLCFGNCTRSCETKSSSKIICSRFVKENRETSQRRWKTVAQLIMNHIGKQKSRAKSWFPAIDSFIGVVYNILRMNERVHRAGILFLLWIFLT